MKMNKAIISAPFGTYVRLPGCTSTRGTYTINPRPGAIWGALTRIYFTKDGIINRMGLRNPGLKSQDFSKHKDAIWSITGLTCNEWIRVVLCTPLCSTIELNFSCPNVDTTLSMKDKQRIIEYALFLRKPGCVIVKLPADPKKATQLYTIAAEAGVSIFHACNTIKTTRGGLSGRAIQDVSIPLVKFLHREGHTVIGGGGIYHPDDVKRYRDAGADHFALGTIFFAPWKLPAVLKEINKCS